MNRLNDQSTFNMEEYTEYDRMAAVSRRLYESYYREVRRPDGTRLWKGHTAMSGVLSLAMRENAIPFFSKGRRKFCKDADAKDFLDKYIETRIHSNGSTRSPIEQIEYEKSIGVKEKFSFIQRFLGVNKVVYAFNHLIDVQLKILEQINELNEVWKQPSARSNNDNGSTPRVVEKRSY
jgi:hypothetical protein